MTRLVPLISALLTAACATAAAARETSVPRAPPAVVDADPLPLPPPPEIEEPLLEADPQELAVVLEHARRLVGGREVVVDGRKFRSDCSNFVRAVFLPSGHDVFAGSADAPDANGVRLIRAYIEAHGRLFDDLVPRPGDVVFFDDTYDRDRDRKVDDPLTHVGIVDLVEPDGTVWFIHRSSRGVVRDPMHLARPTERADGDGRLLNAWLRPQRKADPPGTKRLAGELFAGFGRLRGGAPDPLVKATLEALLAGLDAPPGR